MVVKTLIKMGKLGISVKPKPKMKPVELKTEPEQTQTITRAIFNIVKEHGPLTINQTWDRLRGVDLKHLRNKSQMKMVLRWMRERQQLRLICDHVGPRKKYLYTSWFTKGNMAPDQPTSHNSDENK